jgi:4,5-DOPA dioxygenase extradiol
MSRKMENLMPAIFFGHGNPMNPLAQNSYTKGWAAIGDGIPSPKAILSISAHWYVPETSVTAMASPKTIHDFGGFPKELYQVSYPAPGSPELASRVQNLLEPIYVNLDNEWGLDHGTWAVLCHVFPNADIPIVQLSINETQPATYHYNIGKLLAPLRDEGVLVIGSGNIVHNLHTYAWGSHLVEPYDWAARFEEQAREFLLAGDDRKIINFEELGIDAKKSIPTPDHFLPLLYVIALRQEDEKISFPVEGMDGGSVSMLTVKIG